MCVVGEMSDRENQGGDRRRFKSLLVMVAMALAVALAGNISRRLSDEARVALVGAICALGLIVTIGCLIVLVRQHHDDS